MTYTILSASWANAEQTAAVLQTVESGAVMAYPKKEALWTLFQDWAQTNPVAAYVAETAEQSATLRKVEANSILEGLDAQGRLARADVTLTVKALNSLRGWIMDFKAAVAAAGTLAALKSSVAALPDLPPLDKPTVIQQFKNELADDA